MKAGVWFCAVAPVCAALIVGGCQKEAKEEEQDRSAVITPPMPTTTTPTDERKEALLAVQVAYYGQLERLGELASTAVHWNGSADRSDESNDIGRTLTILKYKGLLERAADPSWRGTVDVGHCLMGLQAGESELLTLLGDAYQSAGMDRSKQPEYVRGRRPVEAFRSPEVVTDQDIRAAQLAYYGQLHRLGELAAALVKRDALGTEDTVGGNLRNLEMISAQMIPLRFRITDSPEDMKAAAKALKALAETEAKILEMVERAYSEMGVPLEEQPPYVRDRRPVAVFEVK